MSRSSSTGLFSGSSNRKGGISLAFTNGGGANGHPSGGLSGSAGPSRISFRDRLSARSRVTNLGILLLFVATGFSMMLNLRYVIKGRAARPPPGFGTWTSFHGTTPDELGANLPPPPPGSNKLDHLVLVVGHAVWAGSSFDGRSRDENWILEPYQTGGSVNTFWKHIEKGLEIADADPRSLLVFSGGQTRTVSLQTEAESYFSLAISSGINIPVLQGFDFSFDSASGKHAVKSNGKAITATSEDVLGTGAHANAGVPTAKGLQGVRMTTENFALDSYQNFIFSVARFREYTGSYPERITVVGYGMKKSRFEELHAKAIRWPVKNYVRGQKRFHYVGIDDDGDTTSEYEGEVSTNGRACTAAAEAAEADRFFYIHRNSKGSRSSSATCTAAMASFWRSAAHATRLDASTLTTPLRPRLQICSIGVHRMARRFRGCIEIAVRMTGTI